MNILFKPGQLTEETSLLTLLPANLFKLRVQMCPFPGDASDTRPEPPLHTRRPAARRASEL